MGTDFNNVKKLREMTSAGLMDCKKSLEESNGDIEKAAEILRKKGIVKAVKKMGRDAKEGAVFSYIHHNGKLGVILELFCETDFVSKNEKFQELGKNIAMHIAASNPLYLNMDEVPADIIEKEKNIQKEALIKEGKPAKVIDKILDGKIKKYCTDIALLHQPFVKEPKMTVEDIIKEGISKLGENISVGRFQRYSL